MPNPQRFGQPLKTFEEHCSTEGTLPWVLFMTYHLLASLIEQPTLPFLGKWEKCLDRTFTFAQVQHILMFTLKSFICTKVQETNYLTPPRATEILPRHVRTLLEMSRGQGNANAHILVLSETIPLLVHSPNNHPEIHRTHCSGWPGLLLTTCPPSRLSYTKDPLCVTYWMLPNRVSHLIGRSNPHDYSQLAPEGGRY